MFHLGNLGEASVIAEFGFNYLLSEFSNYFFCLLIVCVFIKLRLIQQKYLLFWFLYFLSPFFVNFVLFSPTYMNDQFGYHMIVSSIKQGTYDLPQFNLDLDFIKRARVGFSGYFLSVMPMFSLMTVTSIAFINKLIVFFMYVFVSKRIDESKLILFLMIPSLILYSSVGLRDIITLAFGVVSLIYLIEKKVILSLVFAILVLLTKLQNFPGFFLAWTFMFVFRADKSYFRIILGLFVVTSLFFIFFESASPILNLYRLAWAVEDGLTVSAAEVLRLESAGHVVSTLIYDLPRFMLEPLPWKINSPIQVILFIESLLLIMIFLNLFFKDEFYKNKEGIILTIGLLTCMAIHVITVFNLGTLVRYRFIGFFPFLLAMYYLKDSVIIRNKLGRI